MPKPVCVKCRRELRPEKNGVGYLEMASFGPVQVWDSDMWKCPECGIEVLTGFGLGPVAMHFHEHFDRAVAGYREKGMLIEERRKDNASD